MDKENKLNQKNKDIEEILRLGKKVSREAFINKELEKKIKKFTNY